MELALHCPGLFLLVFLQMSYDVISWRHRHEKYQLDHNVDTLSGHTVPILKIFKRQIVNFTSGNAAAITIVFVSSKPVKIRWFKRDRNDLVGDGEIRHMLPIHDKDIYKMSYLRSGDVIATTLSIPKVIEKTTPRRFDTMLTFVQGTIQYWIQTHLLPGMKKDYILHDIDSPMWTTIPAPIITFRRKHVITVHCKVYEPREIPANSISSHRQLLMSRLVPIPSKEDPTNMEYEVIKRIDHKQSYNAEEERNKTRILRASYSKTNHSGSMYELVMEESNASKKHNEGVYGCEFERSPSEMLYVNSIVSLQGRTHVLPPKPKAHLVPCEKKYF